MKSVEISNEGTNIDVIIMNERMKLLDAVFFIVLKKNCHGLLTIWQNQHDLAQILLGPKFFITFEQECDEELVSRWNQT